jgi:hypothetical protein
MAEQRARLLLSGAQRDAPRAAGCFPEPMSTIKRKVIASGRRLLAGLGEFIMALGYSDTPILPDSGYHVHDGDRPQPKIVEPATASTQEAAGRPPSDAVILFDGSLLDRWRGRNGAAEWKAENGYFEVVPGTGDIASAESFGDIQLHIEWAAPSVVKGESQGRGNSGIFLMNAYEIQVLDCYANPTYADGTTGAIYGQYPPLVNACRKPGEWQTYEILWVAPRWDRATLVSPAYVTVIHNGVTLHHHQALRGPTGHRNTPEYAPHGEAPIRLQDHGDLVRYRNIWVRRLKDYDQP